MHTGCGCSGHPAFPAPSYFWAEGIDKPRTQSRRENAKSRSCPTFSRHHPRRRAIQYSRDVSDRNDRPRRTGYPACAGHDSLRSLTSRKTSAARAAPAAADRHRRRRPADPRTVRTFRQHRQQFLERRVVVVVHRGLDHGFDAVVARDEGRIDRAHRGLPLGRRLRLVGDALAPAHGPFVEGGGIGELSSDARRRRHRRGIARGGGR